MFSLTTLSASYSLPVRVRAIFAALFIFSVIVGDAAAQGTRREPIELNALGAPNLSATLTDSFPDPNGDGKAAAGETVTYTATITNSGPTDAGNVVYTNTIDSKSTFVSGSTGVQVMALNDSIRCTFDRAGGTVNCSSNGSYYSIDSSLNTIYGGGNYLNVVTSNPSYDPSTEIFQYDNTLQNLASNSLGTLDGTTLDAAGIRLFVRNITVNSGTGTVSPANPDGTREFTQPNQPYYQYNQILATNEEAAPRTFQFSVPSTVNEFTVDFLVSTKMQVKLVINEVLVNPANFNSNPDLTGEWFELYNAGSFSVNIQNFLINDTSAGGSPGEGCYATNLCHRTPHMISASLNIPSGTYVVLGNNANTSLNGGVPVDYSHGGVLAFANSQDGVRVRTPSSTGSLTIDQTYFTNAAISAKDGVSRELKNPSLDNINMDGSNWADASVTSVYGPGGRGTPKAQNSGYTPFTARSVLAAKINDGARSTRTAAPGAGETVTANIGTIPAGGSAVVTYQVTVANPIPAGATQLSTQGTVSGSNFAAITTDDPDTPAADETATPLALSPTAAAVSISGRAMTASGRGIRNVVIRLTDSEGNIRIATTTSFGYYRFEDVAAGQTYIITATGKRFTFSQQTRVLNVNEDTEGINFIANDGGGFIVNNW